MDLQYCAIRTVLTSSVASVLRRRWLLAPGSFPKALYL
jgi:hypothetical protein